MNPTTVLVTGASGGIGAAICQVLASRGATVILHYHSAQAAVEAVRGGLPGEGHRTAQADLADPTQVLRLWQQLAQRGRIDVLINNRWHLPGPSAAAHLVLGLDGGLAADSLD